MATKFSSITWDQAESQIRRTADTDKLNPPPDHWREMANIYLAFIWRILDGKHDWAYRKPAALTVKADADLLQKAEITALDVNPASTVNYITSNTKEFRTGDRVLMQGVSVTEGEIAGFSAVVVEGGLTAQLKEVGINGANQGYIPTLADWTTGAGCLVVHSLATKVADLSTLALKRIVGIADAPATGTRVWELIEDYTAFRSLAQDQAYDDQIAAYMRGDILEIFQGKNAPAIVSPVMEYDGKPEQYTLATKDNQIELFSEYYTMWFDLMLAWTLDWIKKDRPADLDAQVDHHLRSINEAMAEVR